MDRRGVLVVRFVIDCFRFVIRYSRGTGYRPRFLNVRCPLCLSVRFVCFVCLCVKKTRVPPIATTATSVPEGGACFVQEIPAFFQLFAPYDLVFGCFAHAVNGWMDVSYHIYYLVLELCIFLLDSRQTRTIVFIFFLPFFDTLHVDAQPAP